MGNMNDNESERMERRDQTGQHSVQSEEKSPNRMLRDGLEIFSFSPKTVISWGVLSGLAGLIFGTITIFQRFNSIIDQRILDNPTLNKRLDRNDWEVQGLKEQIEKQNKDITDLQDYFKARTRR